MCGSLLVSEMVGFSPMLGAVQGAAEVELCPLALADFISWCEKALLPFIQIFIIKSKKAPIY